MGNLRSHTHLCLDQPNQINGAGVVEGVIELVRAGLKEKVVRVGLLALKQLLQDPSLGYGATLVDTSLLKLVTTRSMQARHARFC